MKKCVSDVYRNLLIITIIFLTVGCALPDLLKSAGPVVGQSEKMVQKIHQPDSYFVPIEDFENGQMKLYTGSYKFSHYQYTQVKGKPELVSVGKEIITTEFRTHVIENRYIKVALLPQFGGRIISIIDKKSGRELLYQGKDLRIIRSKAGNLHNGWHIELGGVTPSLMQGDHGIGWCMPWNSELVKADKELISIKMSYTVPDLPGALCSVVVSVDSKHSRVKTDFALSASAESAVSWYYRTSYLFTYSANSSLFMPKIFKANKNWFSSIDKSINAGVVRVATGYPEPGVIGQGERFTGTLFSLPLICDLEPGQSVNWSEFLYPVNDMPLIRSAGDFCAYALTKEKNHRFYFNYPGVEYEIQFKRNGRLMFARTVTPRGGEAFEVSASSLPAPADYLTIIFKGKEVLDSRDL
ncbi:MAG: DUF5107 domain-containing protein [Spirochaetes bacterium]|nr:DUF5107 domain-containing protein [Spirochaetota bacterium]MBN2770855.1 DUF5107 domain-containing protein [Spirochaetota bacterium]